VRRGTCRRLGLAGWRAALWVVPGDRGPPRQRACADAGPRPRNNPWRETDHSPPPGRAGRLLITGHFDDSLDTRHMTSACVLHARLPIFDFSMNVFHSIFFQKFQCNYFNTAPTTMWWTVVSSLSMGFCWRRVGGSRSINFQDTCDARIQSFHHCSRYLAVAREVSEAQGLNLRLHLRVTETEESAYKDASNFCDHYSDNCGFVLVGKKKKL